MGRAVSTTMSTMLFPSDKWGRQVRHSSDIIGLRMEPFKDPYRLRGSEMRHLSGALPCIRPRLESDRRLGVEKGQQHPAVGPRRAGEGSWRYIQDKALLTDVEVAAIKHSSVT